MFKRYDIVIYICVLLLAGAAYLIYSGLHQTAGSFARITVDGSFAADYPLSRDTEEIITGVAGGSLKLLIRSGTARVESSTCPDKICVDHFPISHTREVIVCMPNRIVIEIISDEAPPAFDAVSD